MMQDTVFALLIRDISSQCESMKEHLASGGAKSYDEYCQCVGEYNALLRVIGDVKELEKRFIAD